MKRSVKIMMGETKLDLEMGIKRREVDNPVSSSLLFFFSILLLLRLLNCRNFEVRKRIPEKLINNSGSFGNEIETKKMHKSWLFSTFCNTYFLLMIPSHETTFSTDFKWCSSQFSSCSDIEDTALQSSNGWTIALKYPLSSEQDFFENKSKLVESRIKISAFLRQVINGPIW